MPRRTSSPTKHGADALPKLAQDVHQNIEERRDALILEKRTELSEIYDRHDDLVRVRVVRAHLGLICLEGQGDIPYEEVPHHDPL